MDRVGRRKTHWIFSTASLLAQALVIFVPTFTARATGLFLMGAMAAKNGLAYTWAFEIVQNAYKPCANSTVNMLEFMCFIITGIYFLFISRDWKPLVYMFFILHIFGYLLVSVVCVESPKWLLLQGRRRDAIESLNFIARMNRSPARISLTTKFVEQTIAEA